MHFKFNSLWFLLTVFSGQVFSQGSSLLWKIEAPHLARPSYLYGTMHSHDMRAHQFGDSVLAKLNACDAVALEILTGKLDKNAFALLDMMVMKDTTLDMLLPETDYKLVKDYIDTHLNDELRMFSMFVDKIKPIFVSALLTESAMRNDKPYTVDEFFEKKAEESNKKLIGIETVEEQMHALGQIRLEEQAKMLVEQIKSGDRDSLLFEQLMEHYKNQDLNAMMEIYKTEEMPEMFDEALVIKRNHVMAHRMDSIIRMQPTFNAVGALHLAGNEGLVELLRKKGYTVTPVISTYSGNDEPTVYFPGEWKSFTSEEGKVTIDFPATPKVEGYDEHEKYISLIDQNTRSAFLLAFHEFTKEEIKKGENSYAYAIEKIEQTWKDFELLQKDECTVAGIKGTQLKFKTASSGTSMVQRMIIVKKRVYTVGVLGTEEFINSPAVNKFFGSLKLN